MGIIEKTQVGKYNKISISGNNTSEHGNAEAPPHQEEGVVLVVMQLLELRGYFRFVVKKTIIFAIVIGHLIFLYLF